MKQRHIIILLILLFSIQFQVSTLAIPPVTGSIAPASVEIEFLSLEGSQLTPRVFTPGTTLTITYLLSQQVDTAWITVSGSGYSDTDITLEYQRVVNDGFTYAADITITGYTTFHASATVDTTTFTETIPANDLGLSYNRVWTTDDRSPKFLSVNGTSIDQLDGVDEYSGASGLRIRYQSQTQDPSDVYLAYGPSQELGTENLMTEIEPGIFEINISRSEREIWFTARNSNSFEYNADASRSYNYHRLTNGIALTSFDYYTINQESRVESITNLDEIYFSVTTRNETGSETLSISASHGGSSLQPSLLTSSTESTNQSTFTTYFYLLSSPLEVGATVTVSVQLVDGSSGDLVDSFPTKTYTIVRYGAIVVFDSYPQFTNTEVAQVRYTINDPPGRGLEHVHLRVNNASVSVSPGQRSANVSLSPGNNTIFLEATNGANQTTNTTTHIIYDTANPVVTTPALEGSTSHHLQYRYIVQLSDALANDSGLERVHLTVNNATQELEVVSGASAADIDEIITLREGQNTIVIEVFDRAGNKASVTIEKTVTAAENAPSPPSLVPFLVALSVMVHVLRGRYREEGI